MGKSYYRKQAGDTLPFISSPFCMSKAIAFSLQIDQLTRDWSLKWGEWKALMEHYRVDINRRRAGVVINSSLPHLMALEDDVLSTGVVLYHLKVSRLLLPSPVTWEKPQGAATCQEQRCHRAACQFFHRKLASQLIVILLLLYK